MGKTTGFLDYVRTDRPCADVRERVEDFREFKGSLPMDQRREQGGRCMNCGVPFCQSEYGCPLHNLIPEWNEGESVRHCARTPVCADSTGIPSP